MKITMSDKVFQWYKEELTLTNGDFIRFYVRYGGFNSFIKGFSLGIDKDIPEKTKTRIEKDSVTFYIEDSDTWYFDDKDLMIEFNEQLGEPEFRQAV
jgi:uncharacterized protein YneR